VDGGTDRVTCPLIWTNGIDNMPDHEERLEWNHHFVIFNIIANQHEELLGSHDKLLLPLSSHFPHPGQESRPGFVDMIAGCPHAREVNNEG
jgi:hypothetical protein